MAIPSTISAFGPYSGENTRKFKKKSGKVKYFDEDWLTTYKETGRNLPKL